MCMYVHNQDYLHSDRDLCRSANFCRDWCSVVSVVYHFSSFTAADINNAFQFCQVITNILCAI